MNGHNGHKEYVKQLNKIQSMTERIMTNMHESEKGTNHGRTEEIASKRIDFTIKNELRLRSIYKQLDQLKEDVKVFVHQVDHPDKTRNKPGPKPRGIKRLVRSFKPTRTEKPRQLRRSLFYRKFHASGA